MNSLVVHKKSERSLSDTLEFLKALVERNEHRVDIAYVRDLDLIFPQNLIARSRDFKKELFTIELDLWGMGACPMAILNLQTIDQIHTKLDQITLMYEVAELVSKYRVLNYPVLRSIL